MPEIVNSALQAFFAPINNVFNPIGPFWWKMSAAALFLAAMAWVFTLKKEYVNVDAPKQGLLYDLRLWTVISMAPHIIIYLWFNR